jgi:Holliday junction resolvase
MGFIIPSFSFFRGDIMASKYERELKKILEKEDCFVIRSAGSKSIDLIAVSAGPVFVFIEEKSTHADRFYVSNTKKSIEQYETNRQLSNKYGITVVYAVRYIDSSKEKLWKIYEPDYEEDKYPVMKKDEGILLQDWLDDYIL